MCPVQRDQQAAQHKEHSTGAPRRAQIPANTPTCWVGSLFYRQLLSNQTKPTEEAKNKTLMQWIGHDIQAWLLSGMCTLSVELIRSQHILHGWVPAAALGWTPAPTSAAAEFLYGV